MNLFEKKNKAEQITSKPVVKKNAPEKILSMKNEEFLSDEALFQVLNCISKFSNVNGTLFQIHC